MLIRGRLLYGAALVEDERQPADLVLLGGRVFTGDGARPWVEAVSIRGREISAVGSSEELRREIGTATRVIELEGRLVIPGINDAHVHAPWGSEEAIWLRLKADATAEQILEQLRQASAAHPVGTLLRGQLPVALLDSAPERAALDAAAPGHRVILS
jgi:predicted amidohydrolase YtcJ